MHKHAAVFIFRTAMPHSYFSSVQFDARVHRWNFRCWPVPRSPLASLVAIKFGYYTTLWWNSAVNVLETISAARPESMMNCSWIKQQRAREQTFIKYLRWRSEIFPERACPANYPISSLSNFPLNYWRNNLKRKHFRPMCASGEHRKLKSVESSKGEIKFQMPHLSEL